MAYDIGPKIGIEGEAEFRKQINDITQTMRTLGTEMKAVSSEFIGNENSMEAYTAKTDVLNKQIDTQKQKLNLLQQGLQAAANKYGEADSKTQRWQQAVNTATADLNKLEAELRSNNSAMDALASGVNEATTAMDNGGQAASTFGDMLKANLSAEAIKTTAQGITDAVGGIVTSLGSYASESEAATVKATAYFGETGAQAEETAQIIKDVYGAGVGDSLDSVSNAVIEVKQNLDNLSQTNMTNITSQALTLEELYGKDMNESLRGVSALMDQFSIDAQTAMDYLVVGTQNGLDKTNELGDNITEYSAKFAEAGYSAEEYFQLLNNGLDGGAYNLDKVNDAINEITTRLGDGTIADAIGSYSTTTQELFTAWQNGGATQKEVIDSIVTDIQNATTQQEAFNLASTAFGTIAEDGGVKMVSSLTSIGTAYTDVQGKAQEFFDSTTTNQRTFDAAIRQLTEAFAPLADTILNIAAQIVEKITPLIAQFSEWFNSLSPQIQTIIAIIAAVVTAIGPLIVVIGTVISALTSIAAVVGPVIGAVGSLAAVFNPVTLAIGAVVAALVGLYTQSETFRNIVNAAFEAVGSVVSTVLGSILALLTGDTEEFMRIADETAENVMGVVSGALDAIFGFFSDIFGNIKTTVETTIGNIKTTIGTTMDSIKSAWDTAWSGISTTITNAVGSVKTAVDNIKTAVKEKFDDIVSSAKEWGKNLISGFVDGIKSKIGSVASAASSVIKAAGDYISFHSPAKKGEGRYIVDWGANMISGFLDGVESMLGDVSDMGNNVTAQMASALSQPTTATASGITLTANISVGSIRNDQDIKAISTALNRQVRNWGRSLGVV